MANELNSALDAATLNEKATPLPCPFCGWDALVRPHHTDGPAKWMVECSSELVDECGAGPQAVGPTRQNAIANWNRRAAPPPVSLEAAREAFRKCTDYWPPEWTTSREHCDKMLEAVIVAALPPVEPPILEIEGGNLVRFIDMVRSLRPVLCVADGSYSDVQLARVWDGIRALTVPPVASVPTGEPHEPSYSLGYMHGVKAERARCVPPGVSVTAEDIAWFCDHFQGCADSDVPFVNRTLAALTGGK